MELRSFGDLFWKVAPNKFFWSVLIGIVSGLLYAGILPLLMYAASIETLNELNFLSNKDGFFATNNPKLVLFFFSFIVVVIVIKVLSRAMTLVITESAATQCRISLYERVQRLSIVELERIGQARIINLLTLDVQNITMAAVSLPQIWISLFTILGTFLYLFSIDQYAFYMVSVFLALGGVCFYIPMLFVSKMFEKSRIQHDTVQEGLRGLVFGAKELKLNAAKKSAFFSQELEKPEFQIRRQEVMANTLIIFVQEFMTLYSFVAIGFITFFLPNLVNLTQTNIFAVIITLMYVTGPLSVLLGMVNNINKGKVSLNRLQEFYSLLNEEKVTSDTVQFTPLDEIGIKGLNYQYSNSNTEFALQDINLTFKKGEITMIVGGNGSGKSTLSKCITLHYLAGEGMVTFDNLCVKEYGVQNAREHISAIYSDYHLFQNLYGIDEDNVTSEDIERYLTYLELEHCVEVEGGKLSNIKLSDGQRRRVALLTLLLENRRVCLFDEWAADQDPRFKDIFYRRILPDLKAKNKIVIVISHDDRYFDCADKVVEMEMGKVKGVFVPKECADTSYKPGACLV
ncbi:MULTISPECIES: cyclic peptide export ABC transporter [unclassified Pseudoalteromonas]|uniref:cyclic peptide export ABC transporter n=1 Tax=unclassified Pseudoalteromonas TaxID=194690 RepID=UPI0020977444|nr:cyclic peptide export ABC transporter [Pseudoalteromonas sp. XMcav2-N]MCO7191003.1 cyclic peptide export ABC transporter [Pseudoalteromonas sp. XMcav2-N]